MTQLNWRPAEELKDALNIYDPYRGRCTVPFGLIIEWEAVTGYSYSIYGDEFSGDNARGCDCCSYDYKFPDNFENVKRFAVLELE